MVCSQLCPAHHLYVCVYLLIILILLANWGHFAGPHTFKGPFDGSDVVLRLRFGVRSGLGSGVLSWMARVRLGAVSMCESFLKYAEVNRWPVR